MSLAVSDDGRWLAIAGAGHVTNDVFVRLWDLRAEDILTSSIDLPTYQGQLCSLAVSRDGDWIATGNEDGAVRLWRISNLTHAVTATDLRMHNDPVRAIRFAPDGKSLITAAGSGSGKGTVRAWSLDGGDASADVVLADSSRGRRAVRDHVRRPLAVHGERRTVAARPRSHRDRRKTKPAPCSKAKPVPCRRWR